MLERRVNQRKPGERRGEVRFLKTSITKARTPLIRRQGVIDLSFGDPDREVQIRNTPTAFDALEPENRTEEQNKARWALRESASSKGKTEKYIADYVRTMKKSPTVENINAEEIYHKKGAQQVRGLAKVITPSGFRRVLVETEPIREWVFQNLEPTKLKVLVPGRVEYFLRLLNTDKPLALFTKIVGIEKTISLLKLACAENEALERVPSFIRGFGEESTAHFVNAVGPQKAVEFISQYWLSKNRYSGWQLNEEGYTARGSSEFQGETDYGYLKKWDKQTLEKLVIGVSGLKAAFLIDLAEHTRAIEQEKRKTLSRNVFETCIERFGIDNVIRFVNRNIPNPTRFTVGEGYSLIRLMNTALEKNFKLR